MKKIVPFRKEIDFKTNIAEITSISLEHTLKVDDYLIDGDFIVSGEYKMADISTNTEIFGFKLPFSISIDEKYLLDKIRVDIDDFYYEIVNEKTLVVNIDVLINNLEEKPLMEVISNNKKEIKKELEEIEEVRKEIDEEIECEKIIKEEVTEIIEMKEQKNIEHEIIENPIKIIDEKIIPVNLERKNEEIFNSFKEVENFSTYRVYIVREGDILDNIIEKYNTNKELLEKYNKLNEIKIGDKIIIPSE